MPIVSPKFNSSIMKCCMCTISSCPRSCANFVSNQTTGNKYNGADIHSHHHGHQFHMTGSCPAPLAMTTRSGHARPLGASNPCSMSGSTVNPSLHRNTVATRDRHQVCLYFTKGTNIYCNIIKAENINHLVLTRGKRNSVYEWHKFAHETKMPRRDHILKWMLICFGITFFEANNSISKPYNELDNSQEHTSLFTKNMVSINMYNSELNNIYDVWRHDSPS
jgi:hypothetical protein